MSMSALIAKLIEAGTPAELVAEVAMELGRAQAANDALEKRRETERQNSTRYRSRGGGQIPGWMRHEVFERDGYRCADCGAEDKLECDHVMPLMHGGETSLENLQTLCKPCNARKRDRLRKADKRGLTRTNAETEDKRGKSRITSDPPKVSPKNNIQTPSSPPAEGSEAEASSPQPRAWALPAGVSLQVWQDFKRNRERKRLPNTETAWKTFNDDLNRISARTGIPPPELIERCTAKGWASINDPRDENDRQQRTYGMAGHQPPDDGLSSTARAAVAVFGR